MALIWVSVTLVTSASLVVWPLHAAGSGGVVALPSHVKTTRTGARKCVPVMVRTSPPSGLPVVGVMVEIVGAVLGGGGSIGEEPKVTVAVFETLFTVAVTVTAPADPLVSVAVATPLVVVLITEEPLAPVSVKEPPVVVNWTAVPFTTGCPFWVTVAVITDVEFTSGLAFETVSTTLAPDGGVLGVVVVIGVVDGDVGDSPLHPAKIRSSATEVATKNFRCRMSIISTPVIRSSHPTHQAQPPHE